MHPSILIISGSWGRKNKFIAGVGELGEELEGLRARLEELVGGGAGGGRVGAVLGRVGGGVVVGWDHLGECLGEGLQ